MFDMANYLYTEGIDKKMTNDGRWKKRKAVLSGCDEMRVSQMHKWLTKAEQSMYDVDNVSVCLAGSPSDNASNVMIFVIYNLDFCVYIS